MSTSSLPGYRPPSVNPTPTYSAEPQAYEQRLALNRLRQRPSTDFVKQSRSGGVSLRLVEQDDNITLPVYGCGDSVEGSIVVAKPDGVTSVEVKIEGTLRLKEVAEGGNTAHRLVLSVQTLWTRDHRAGQCPPSLPFSITLPTTFSDGREVYPLPPTHEAHMSGVPGFHADIEYSVSALISRTKSSSLLRPGNNIVSTPFVYYPRSRPAVPLPPRMQHDSSSPTPMETSDWRCFESLMSARTPNSRGVLAKFYIPSSRVFCMAEPIPFYLTYTSSAKALAAFLPFAPLPPSRMSRQHTRVQLIRQTSVDVRNAVLIGAKTDMWRTVEIGQAVFQHEGDGPSWMSFSGEIRVSPQTRIGGFKAGGLTIKDFIVLSMTPPEPLKAPFGELRQVVPIRLTTDPWSMDGTGQAFAASDYSIALSPEDEFLDLRVPAYAPP
ncbi:hypothetical protein IEO21_08442 [Rhodonia placenta]|uniref:Uncharacterized protein n=1 Tax=Rhodonia placenta TaxID=104341 RepID=A0A8H7NWE1_9APHY|nr:hypothetical protein IEO21_08442 [Postia placenta]